MFALTFVSGCVSTGQSPTLAKYTEEQITRCYNSLTIKEQDEAQRNARAAMTNTALIPIVGPLMVDGSEELYKEYEKICKRKGIV